MADYKRIWLEPAPGSDPDGGRMWAANDVWGDGTEYVLASKADARVKELEARLAEAEKVIERVVDVYGNMEDGDGNPCPEIRAARAWMEEGK